MAEKAFLDINGLVVYDNEIKDLIDEKLDKDQGVANEGKLLGINSSGLVVPVIAPITGVSDVKVDGVSVVDTFGVAEIDLTDKQAALTTAQLAVINANAFTTTEKNKLAGIEPGAEVNLINGVSVNGTPVTVDGDLIADIDVPTTLAELDPTGFTYVESVTAGTTNVTIGGSAKNPTISVQALEFPNQFISSELPTGAVGDPLTALDLSILEPIITGKTPAENDTVIFANGIQAIITSIDSGNDEFDAVISVIPIATAFPAITGDPMDNTALAALFNGKQNSLNTTQMDAVNSGITAAKVTKLDGVESGAQVNIIEAIEFNGVQVPVNNKTAEITAPDIFNTDFGDANEGKYLIVGLDGEGIDFVTIRAITNQEILDLFA